MAQILWLASYPKSGNTWLRALLANYLAADEDRPADINRLPELSFSDARASYYARASGRPIEGAGVEEILRLRPRVLAGLAATRAGRVFVKTHFVCGSIDGIATIPAALSAGAIYVVRNPLDTCVSFAHHFGLPLANAVRAIGFTGLRTAAQAEQVAQWVSDWSSHARSWLDQTGIAVHLVRYEDLHADPARAFAAVVRFLGFAVEQARLERAIARSAFGVLAAQERQAGFVEASRKADAFFRQGRVGGWRDSLTAAEAGSIVDRHREMMTRLGYLGADGVLAV